MHLDGGDVLRARTIILACGVSWRQLPIDGFDRLAGKGIFYGAARSEAANVHGLDVHIVGAGNSAGQAAMFFSDPRAERDDPLPRRRRSRRACRATSSTSSLPAEHPRADALRGRGGPRRGLARGDRRPRHARRGRDDAPESGGLFIFIGADAETGWLPPEIALDRQRLRAHRAPTCAAAGRWELERDPYLLETSVPGIFACGDVRFGPVKRVAAAVGEGSMAIAFVHQYIRQLEGNQALDTEARAARAT